MSNFSAIHLQSGLVAIVDSTEFEVVSNHVWTAVKKGHTYYAVRKLRISPGKHGRMTQYMHTLITGYTRTDHINGNGLDNRKENLRNSTKAQNNRNRRKILKSSSRFKGVTWDKLNNSWQSKIGFNGKTHMLGRYISEEEAARVYDEAARKYFGEFASLNFPKPNERSALIGAGL